ncbi:MAG TPA: AAA family ATPase [Pirellulales bacterium]|nr:AAA family ATPase [Pirellulales bacterium]
MYEAFFGFRDRPFLAAPLAKRYFAGGPAEGVRQTIARCVDRGEGIGLVVGPAGTGKTLVCQLLADQFRSRMAVAFLSSGRIRTARNLFQAILFELGLPYRGMEEGDLRLTLVDHVANKEGHPGGLLLLVDEAHLLPLRLLEEIRLLTNLQRAGQPRVRVVVAGNTSHEERLATPKLESFNQWIAARCYLQSFSHDESLAYVRAQIAGVDGQAESAFSDDALTAIHRSTDGIPRYINQLCDHALVLATAGGFRQIGAAGIEEAWADLQQLPTQWIPTAAASEQAPDIIEFGSLEDDVLPITSSADKQSRHTATGPRLHAIGDGSESELFYGEPGERIERIEARLDAIDTDYDPPATGVPEVELVFGEPADPFEEEFAEEEVVVDRFADLESSAFADRPMVRSAEGRELGAMLDDFRERLRPADDPVLPEESSTISIGVGSPPLEISASAEIAATTGEATASDDDDLIVVEDDPPEPPPRTPSPPKGRRQEYRQLFARLRRG